MSPTPQLFAGADYVPQRDDRRLLSQIDRIRNLMADGHWRTLKQIGDATGDPTPSVSAQLRHLTRAEHGSHIKEKRYAGDGLFEYRIVPGSGKPCQLRLR
jgi:hypothetical protein